MTTPVNILDSKTAQTAKVTRFGQLVVAPLDYSVPVEHELDVVDTAFNFVEPQADHSIIITDIITSALPDISPVDSADVEIYEAGAIDSTIVLTGIVRPQLTRGQNLALIGLNLIVPEGRWVNAMTTDDTVIVTIMFYRAPVERV